MASGWGDVEDSETGHTKSGRKLKVISFDTLIVNVNVGYFLESRSKSLHRL